MVHFWIGPLAVLIFDPCVLIEASRTEAKRIEVYADTTIAGLHDLWRDGDWVDLYLVEKTGRQTPVAFGLRVTAIRPVALKNLHYEICFEASQQTCQVIDKAGKEGVLSAVLIPPKSQHDAARLERLRSGIQTAK